MFAALTLIGFKLGEAISIEAGQTMAFTVLALTQVVQAFNMRSGHSLFTIGIFTNKTLNLAALSSVLLVLLVLFTPLNSIFGLVYLPWYMYLIALGLIIVPFIVMEVSKLMGLVKKH